MCPKAEPEKLYSISIPCASSPPTSCASLQTRSPCGWWLAWEDASHHPNGRGGNLVCRLGIIRMRISGGWLFLLARFGHSSNQINKINFAWNVFLQVTKINLSKSSPQNYNYNLTSKMFTHSSLSGSSVDVVIMVIILKSYAVRLWLVNRECKLFLTSSLPWLGFLDQQCTIM